LRSSADFHKRAKKERKKSKQITRAEHNPNQKSQTAADQQEI